MSSTTINFGSPSPGGSGTGFLPSIRCVACGVNAALSDAEYCAACGWPLRQFCPYGCGTSVRLHDGFKPTTRCPGCAKSYRVCSGAQCGRLYTTRESVCRNPHPDPLPLEEGATPWSGLGGSPDARRSRRRNRDLTTLGQGTPTAGPSVSAASGFGGLAAIHDRVYFTSGAFLYSFSAQGTPGPILNLQGEIAYPQWGIVAVDGVFFCAHRNSVTLVDIEHMTVLNTVSGNFAAQIAVGSNWVGLHGHGGNASALILTNTGNVVAEIHLPFPFGSLASICASNSQVFFITKNKVAILDVSGEFQGEYPLPEGEPVGAFVAGEELVVLQLDDGVLRLSKPLSSSGSGSLVVRSDESAGVPPVVIDQTLYYIARRPDQTIAAIPIGLTEGGRMGAPLPFVRAARLLEVVGLTDGRNHALVAVYETDSQTEVWVIPADGSNPRSLYEGFRGLPIRIAIVDGAVAIACPGKSDSRVRIYA